MDETKKLIHSHTFQVACFQALIGAVVIFQSSYPEAGWIAILKSALDVYIRMQTSKPIE